MPAISEQMVSMPGMDDMKDAGPIFVNELNAIVPMEMHDWKTLATLKPMTGYRRSQLSTPIGDRRLARDICAMRR